MSSDAGVDVRLLEPLLQDLVRLIGLPSTMAIVAAHGGRLLNIPKRAELNDGLVTLIGEERAAILGRHYGGERPLIPKALEALRAARDQQIRALSAEKSVRELSRQYGLHERRIWQIKRAGTLPAPTHPQPQVGLFDD